MVIVSIGLLRYPVLFLSNDVCLQLENDITVRVSLHLSNCRLCFMRISCSTGVICYLYQAEDGQDPYICKIIEMFEAIDGTPHVTCQWYYRAQDTVNLCFIVYQLTLAVRCSAFLIVSVLLQDIKENWELIDNKRVFLSEVKNDNLLSCLIKKLTIVKVGVSVYDNYFLFFYLFHFQFNNTQFSGETR